MPLWLIIATNVYMATMLPLGLILWATRVSE